MNKQPGSRHVQYRKVSINDRPKKADIFTTQVLSLGSFLLGATATSGRTPQSVVTWIVLKPPASNGLECPHQNEALRIPQIVLPPAQVANWQARLSWKAERRANPERYFCW